MIAVPNSTDDSTEIFSQNPKTLAAPVAADPTAKGGAIVGREVDSGWDLFLSKAADHDRPAHDSILICMVAHVMTIS